MCIAWRTIHMKYQDLFSLKIYIYIYIYIFFLECCLLQIWLSALRVNIYNWEASIS